jgi:hypothetical protein
MKKWGLFIVMFLLSASSVFSQKLRWEMDEEKKYQVPVGACSWDNIQQSDFYSIINENSKDVILNATATVELAQVLESQPETKYEMEAYFGAWDDESLYQLPFFYIFGITMETKYQRPIDMLFYGCNREYDCGGQFTPPTLPYFAIYRVADGQRTLIGEIKEQPKNSFEEDVLNIIKR